METRDCSADTQITACSNFTLVEMKFCSECGNRVSVIIQDSFERYICNQCGTVHYLNPKPCVTAVIADCNKVLLTKRAIEPGLDKWDLVGGFIENNEHPHTALAREVHEELGVHLAKFEFLGFFMDVYGKESIPTLNIAFVCQIDGEPKIQVNEFDQVKWFPISNLPNKYAFKNVKDILDHYQQFLEDRELPNIAST